MHIYVLGTAVCIHLGACILLFNSGCLEVFSWAHCMLLKRMQHIFKRCEFLFYFLLLDVIFISSLFRFFFLYFEINLRRKEAKKMYLTFFMGFLLHGTAVDYCTNCNSFSFCYFFLQWNTRWIYAYAFKALLLQTRETKYIPEW